MKRRDILTAAGVGLAATALAGCNDKSEKPAAGESKQASEQQTFNWKMVTSWPKNFPGVGVGAERFAQLVNRTRPDPTGPDQTIQDLTGPDRSPAKIRTQE